MVQRTKANNERNIGLTVIGRMHTLVRTTPLFAAPVQLRHPPRIVVELLQHLTISRRATQLLLWKAMALTKLLKTI
jgi:hypothetical protein